MKSQNEYQHLNLECLHFQWDGECGSQLTSHLPAPYSTFSETWKFKEDNL